MKLNIGIINEGSIKYIDCESRTQKEEDVAHDYDQAVDLVGNGRYNHLMLAACCMVMLAVATDMFSFAIVVASASCDFQLSDRQKGLLNSTPMASLLFAFFWGYYADTAGRRKALILSCSMGFVFCSLTSIAPNWYTMLVFKFLGSSFASGGFGIVVTYLGESTGIKHRGIYIQIINVFNLFSEFIYFGLAYIILGFSFNIEIPWLSITLRPWRLYTFLMASELGISAILLLFLYESPKYLASTGQEGKALVVLQKMFVTNGGCKEDYKVKRIKLSVLVGKKGKCNFLSIFTSLGPLLKPPLRTRTLQMFYITLVVCTTNNAFTVWLPIIVNQFFISIDNGVKEDKNFCSRINDNSTGVTIFERIEQIECNDVISDRTLYCGMILGTALAFINLLIARFATYRRQLVILTLTVSAISCILINYVVYPILSLTLFALIQWTSVCIGIVGSYFVDLFPTGQRALATSLGMMIGRIGAFVGINVIGAVITTHCEATFYSWTIFIFSAIAVTMMLPSEKKIMNIIFSK